MTREQLTAMQKAAQIRADELNHKANTLYAQRQFSANQAMASTAAVCQLMADMCNAALKVTP